MMNGHTDYFALLGLPAVYELDGGDLERAYLECCREAHPDHAGADAAAQGEALERMSGINEAHAVLRDPARRAEYLLMLRGGMAAEQDKSLPEGFLQFILETREEMEAAQERGDRERAESLLAQVQEQRREIEEALRRGFAQPPTAPGLRDLRRNLNALRYLARLESARS